MVTLNNLTVIPNNPMGMLPKGKCPLKAIPNNLTATRLKVKICKGKFRPKVIPNNLTAMHPKGKCLLKVILNNLMAMLPKAHLHLHPLKARLLPLLHLLP